MNKFFDHFFQTVVLASNNFMKLWRHIKGKMECPVRNLPAFSMEKNDKGVP